MSDDEMATRVTQQCEPIPIHCRSTGAVRIKRGDHGIRRYLPGGWREETLPINVFIIEHPAGLCLFDTGQTARAAHPGYFPRWYPFFRLARFELGPDDEAAPHMRRLGLEPAAVRWVVLSHLHTDHVGGLSAFAQARVLVARAEGERAIGLGGRLRGYLPQHWPAGVQPSLIDFTGPPVGPFGGSFDVAGDGRLVLVPSPGHTPGHMSLLARTRERRYLLCGDLVHSAAELSQVAPDIASYCRRAAVMPLATHDCRATDILATGAW